jgi:hypothetical protein
MADGAAAGEWSLTADSTEYPRAEASLEADQW